MDISYALTPFLAWLIAGVIKFLVNSIKTKQLAWRLIGYGGFPSNHSAIVSSTTVLIALKEGMSHPAFGVAITLAFIVMLDANSLRHQIGKHATVLNKLTANAENYLPLRERIGHTRLEIIAGILAGILVALVINFLWH
ncbi:MAG: divergent PAP2 family protein [Burkholderiales bacterium]|jgi:acid phosphatase family membrane protein YuiD|nr:divergent PAP2 family protein [Burkholderiales bacterium]